MQTLRIFALVALLLLTGCGDKNEPQNAKTSKPELLFYVGITMVKPMSELAKAFEAKEGVSIKILQGGSEDLYQSAKSSKAGDLYMPGSLSYRTKYLKEGILEQDAAFVGYNRAALMVHKGNPKGVPADIKALLSSEYKTVLCNPESGSIGSQTKKILEASGIYKEAMAKAVYLTTDSRNLTKAIKDGDADLTLNWRATGFWEGNKEFVDMIDLPESTAPRNVLVLVPLKSSKYPQKVKAFMDFARSPQGRQVFHDFGFLTKEELKNFETLTF